MALRSGEECTWRGVLSLARPSRPAGTAGPPERGSCQPARRSSQTDQRAAVLRSLTTPAVRVNCGWEEQGQMRIGSLITRSDDDYVKTGGDKTLNHRDTESTAIWKTA